MAADISHRLARTLGDLAIRGATWLLI